jgi:hypothetical protein
MEIPIVAHLMRNLTDPFNEANNKLLAYPPRYILLLLIIFNPLLDFVALLLSGSRRQIKEGLRLHIIHSL